MKLHSASVLAMLATCALFALGPRAGIAASVVPLDLDEIATRSVQIVHVRCTANSALSDAAIGVVTVSTFDVLDHAKGDPASTLAVRQAGGMLNGLAVDYHAPKFRVGEEYVLFLPAPSKLGLASPVGLAQGAFAVTQGPGGKDVSNGRDFAELLVGIDPALIPPGTLARLQNGSAFRGRMDLGDFMALLRAKGGK